MRDWGQDWDDEAGFFEKEPRPVDEAADGRWGYKAWVESCWKWQMVESVTAELEGELCTPPHAVHKRAACLHRAPLPAGRLAASPFIAA